MIRWDAMHIVNLGADLWICASTMKIMMEYPNVFGGSMLSESDRLLVAYDLFKNFCRVGKIECFAEFISSFLSSWLVHVELSKLSWYV